MKAAAKRAGPKSIVEMSRDELMDQLERNCGLSPPSVPASKTSEEWADWEVSSGILICARFEPDKRKATINALEIMLAEHAMPLEMLIPPMERALGRKLTAAEIETCTIYD